MNEKDLLTTGDVARACGVSQATVIRWVDSGLLSGFKIPGSRHRRIPREQMRRFMEEHCVPLSVNGDLNKC